MWYTSYPVIAAGVIGVAAYVATRPKKAPAKSKMAQSIMSAPEVNLAPPKNDPISSTELARYDGSDPSKPIYVAIKGKVFDVTNKKEMYGVGGGYHVFAGKDASKGLGAASLAQLTGMSSLDPKDAIPDYTGLDDKERKTLDQWESFFEKRYNIVGKVI